nr:basic salivary proline-rich protein 2-like [Anas platyrhynchos]|eukprot:XP_027309818.1 basic salivary proline-rich protein 2-like [Anas platyrhynchos]
MNGKREGGREGRKAESRFSLRKDARGCPGKEAGQWAARRGRSRSGVRASPALPPPREGVSFVQGEPPSSARSPGLPEVLPTGANLGESSPALLPTRLWPQPHERMGERRRSVSQELPQLRCIAPASLKGEASEEQPQQAPSSSARLSSPPPQPASSFSLQNFPRCCEQGSAGCFSPAALRLLPPRRRFAAGGRSAPLPPRRLPEPPRASSGGCSWKGAAEEDGRAARSWLTPGRVLAPKGDRPQHEVAGGVPAPLAAPGGSAPLPPPTGRPGAPSPGLASALPASSAQHAAFSFPFGFPIIIYLFIYLFFPSPLHHSIPPSV